MSQAIVDASMTTEERAQLWQQRLFEAVAGMTNYLAERHARDTLPAWLGVQADIFRDLPGEGDGDHLAWQRIFFRGQALMERFLVGHFGHAAMQTWALANARIYAMIEPDRGCGAADVIDRLRRQLENYDSAIAVLESEPACATIRISRCGIWNYRERARKRGIPITLDSPCDYCTKAVAANIMAKGYAPRHELFSDGEVHGCQWSALASDLPAHP
ncbi:hypothetical protein LVJ94_41925 [Pendulispora rubella]|uniref:Uncharacterized protein n=1 Tax=Pendulispora rubella TaxID=2741070 RepID=A0ABZ2L0V8_9BACT